MHTPEHCSHFHDEIIFDSRYGERSCPLCEKTETLLEEEEKNNALLKLNEKLTKKPNETSNN